MIWTNEKDENVMGVVVLPLKVITAFPFDTAIFAAIARPTGVATPGILMASAPQHVAEAMTQPNSDRVCKQQLRSNRRTYDIK